MSLGRAKPTVIPFRPLSLKVGQKKVALPRPLCIRIPLRNGFVLELELLVNRGTLLIILKIPPIDGVKVLI